LWTGKNRKDDPYLFLGVVPERPGVGYDLSGLAPLRHIPGSQHGRPRFSRRTRGSHRLPVAGASGYISDRIRKRKVFVWLGYIFGGLSRAGLCVLDGLAASDPLPYPRPGRKDTWAPRDAIIADLSTDENRGKNFGILRTMDNLGAICGILTCILFVGSLGYRNLFLVAAVPSFIGAALIISVGRERSRTGRRYSRG